MKLKIPWAKKSSQFSTLIFINRFFKFLLLISLNLANVMLYMNYMCNGAPSFWTLFISAWSSIQKRFLLVSFENLSYGIDQKEG